MPAAAVPLLVAMVTALILAVHCYRLRAIGTALVALTFAAAGTAVWALPESLTLLTHDRDTMLALRMAVLPGTIVVSVSYYCLVLAVEDRNWRLTRRLVVLLAVEPVVVLVWAATNPWHQLVGTATTVSSSGRWVYEWGPVMFGHVAWSASLLGIGVGRLTRLLINDRADRAVYGWMLAALVPSVGANIIWITRVYPTANMAVVGVAAGLLITYIAVRYELYNHVHLAHQRVFQAVEDAVVVVDSDWVIVDANKAAVTIVDRVPGWDGRPLIGLRGGEILRGMAERSRTIGDQLVTNAFGTGLDLHIRVSPVTDRLDRVIGWTYVARDISAITRRQNHLEDTNSRLRDQIRRTALSREELAEQAVRDPLTNLYNRRFLMERLALAVDGKTPIMTIAVIDIDHFKNINDTVGHQGGDEVLIRFAELLRGAVRPLDVVARLGGEEFVVLFPGVREDQAWRRVNELRARVAADPMAVHGRELRITFSAGIAGLRPVHTVRTLLNEADHALYRAKNLGRDQVVRSQPA